MIKELELMGNPVEEITIRMWLDSQQLFEMQPTLQGEELKNIKQVIETLEELVKCHY